MAALVAACGLHGWPASQSGTLPSTCTRITLLSGPCLSRLPSTDVCVTLLDTCCCATACVIKLQTGTVQRERGREWTD